MFIKLSDVCIVIFIILKLTNVLKVSWWWGIGFAILITIFKISLYLYKRKLDNDIVEITKRLFRLKF